MTRYVRLILFLVSYSISLNILHSQETFWEYRGAPFRTELHDVDRVLLFRDVLLGASSNRTYVYDASLAHWVHQSSNGVLSFYEGMGGRIYSLPYGKGLNFSIDTGKSWSSIGVFNNRDCFSVGQNKKTKTLLVGEFGLVGGGPVGNIFRSTDDGSSWTITLNLALDACIAFGFDSLGNTYASSFERLYRSSDDGISWNRITEGLPSGGLLIRSMASSLSGKLFIGSQHGLFSTTDGGSTWSNTDSLTVGRAIVTKICVNHDGVIFVGTGDNGLFRSTDDGQTWNPITEGLHGVWVIDLSIDPNGRMAATTASGGRAYSHISTTNGDEWLTLPLVQPDTIKMLMLSMVFDTTGRLLLGGDGSFGLMSTTDNGSTWEQIGNPAGVCWSLVINAETHSFYYTNGKEIFRSTNSGSDWERVLYYSYQLSVFNNICITRDGVIYAKQSYAPLYYSTNDGLTWNNPTTTDSFMTLLEYADAIGAGTNGEIFVAGGALPGLSIPPYLLKSKDIGSTWELLSYLPFPDRVNPYRVFSDSLLVIVSSYNHGLCISRDGGYHWSNPDSLEQFKDRYITSVRKDSQGNYLVASRDGSFHYSTDQGRSWTEETRGLNSEIWDISVDEDGIIYLATSSGLYQSKGLLTPVPEQSSTQALPISFSLYQNYPNPFNPVTRIRFSIPQLSYATVEVFNVLGKHVVTLVSTDLPPGNYDVEWDASEQPSGLYFCRLRADTYVETKKLLLLK